MTDTTPRVRVRPARQDDDAGLLALDSAAWSAESGFPSAAAAQRTTFFDEANGPDRHLVAELDGRLAGYVRMRPCTSLPENAHVLCIFGLAVAAAARRSGVASALLVAAEELARNHSMRKVRLHVFGVNAPARRLYERLGYAVEGALRAEFVIDGEPVDDVLMAKHLS